MRLMQLIRQKLNFANHIITSNIYTFSAIEISRQVNDISVLDRDVVRTDLDIFILLKQYYP
jgi:hypothetical protein